MNNTAVEIAPEPIFPNPPRFYWTKRLAIWTVIALVLLSVLMVWWRHEARRRLVADLEAYRASVAPLLQAALRTQRLPDNQNAAITLLSAAGSITQGSLGPAPSYPTYTTSNFLMSYDFSLPLPPTAQTTADAMLASNTPQIGLARIARFQKEIDWDVGNRRINTQGFNQLNGLLRLKAFQEHLKGHDAEAVELLLDQLFLSEANRYYGANSLVSSTAQTAAAISWDLEVLPDSNAATQPTGAASRKQLQALIDGLLDDSRQRRDYELGWIRSIVSRAEMALSAKLPQRAGPGLMQEPLAMPLFLMDARRSLKESAKFVDALRALDFAAVRSSTLRPYVQQTNLSRFASFRTSNSSPVSYRDVVAYLQSLTERRAAAVQLAVRLYALDHQMQRPKTLNDLVPTYLSAIPIDPFAPGSRPLSYIATWPARIYSFGEDGYDNHGTARPTPTASGAPFDLVFPLARPGPMPTYSTTGSSAGSQSP